MKKIKILNKIIILVVLISSIFILTDCENKKEENDFISAILDTKGDILIDTKDINKTATFINYEVDDKVIQFIAVKAEDDTVRVAFNTCQACNPSPKAYFIQEEDHFICQNCKNKFKVNEIGNVKGGCNPIPVEEKKIDDDQIIIDKNYVLNFKEKFENWEGPTA